MSMNPRTRVSRRDLLKGLGVGAALLPMLQIDEAFGASCIVGGPKRVFILVWPDGMISKQSSTWVAEAGANYTLPAFMKSLEPYKSDLILMDGIDYDFVKDSPNPTRGEVSGHACFQGMLTGAFYQKFGTGTSSNVGGGISIDQHIGKQLRSKGYTGLASLNLGVFVKSPARLSWLAAGSPVLPDTDPYHVFNTLFADAKPTPTPQPGTLADAGSGPSPADITRLMKKSVLDAVIGDLNRFRKTVGTDDQRNIDSHLQSVRELEQQLAPPAGGGGGPGSTVGSSDACAAPVYTGTKLDTGASANAPALVKMQMDLSVAAFAADATRVVVMQIADQGAANLILGNLGFSTGGKSGNTGDLYGVHAIAHRNATEKVKVDTWFQEQVAYIIGRLKSVKDSAGATMLDSSAVLAINNMRTGIHEYEGVPAILAGSCGGYFKTGRSLKLTNVRNNQVLAALANAVGVPTADGTFGEKSYGTELKSLSSL